MLLCVPVSGGLDSFIAYHYGLRKYGRSNVTPLFVAYNQPYFSKELDAVGRLYSGTSIVITKADLCVKELNNVPTVTKQEIFGRNLLIAFYGALVAPRVWLAALQTEMNPLAVRDKHPEFFHLASAILTYVMKGRQFETVVETPFASATKSDIVQTALTFLHLTPDQLRSTVSCYHETEHNCGACSTCFKRWIAMTNNGIEEDYAEPIADNNYGWCVVAQMREEIAAKQFSGRFSTSRLEETHRALLKTGLFGGRLL